MTNNDIRKGGELMIFMDNEAIAFAKTHTLTMTANTTDISSKDHGEYAPQIPTTIAWEATTENLYSDTGIARVRDAMQRKQTVDIVFGKPTNYTASGIVDTANAWVQPEGVNQVFYGKAYITSLTVNANNGELATFSATFTGAGPLGPQA